MKLLGRLCPSFRGPCGSPTTRRALRSLHSAIDHCALLRKAAERDEDRSAPTAHLRAAELHLAAVSRWLRHADAHGAVGGGQSGGPNVDGLLLEQELMQELGLTEGLAPPEEEEFFFETFFPPAQCERLVKQASCSVKSSGFLFPGKLYMSSVRLCFCSSIMGVEARFTIPWDEVDRVSLEPRRGNFDQVHVTLKSQTSFDGTLVQKLDVRIFDAKSLWTLHGCAQLFTGYGIFSDKDTSMVAGRTSARTCTPPTLFHRIDSGASLMNTYVWQLQRRVTMWHSSWKAPFLPHDGEKRVGWCAIEDRYFRHPQLPQGKSHDEALEAAAIGDGPPPIQEVHFLGKMRTCAWSIQRDTECDKDGWQYAIDFYLDANMWNPSITPFSHVRRRRWHATFVHVPTDTTGSCADVSFSAQGLEGGKTLSRSEREAPPVPSGQQTRTPHHDCLGVPKSLEERTSAIPKVSSTFLQMMASSPTGGVTLLHDVHEPVVKADIGILSLMDLASALEADDWETCGPMAAYFRALGARNLDMGPWASGCGAAARVKGKVRSLEMVAPCPPAPMCPKETRVHSTWHVLSAEHKIVQECVTMSLDVPYGECFNVVYSDTYTVEEATGRTCMSRAVGIEWLKSVWTKRLVEANVPKEMKKDAMTWVEVLREEIERRRLGRN